MIKLKIYERIRFLRKEHLKLTQEEFATKIKISRSNLGSIETGRINVTDRVINDICQAFSVNGDWLKTGDGEILKVYSDDLDGFINQLSSKYDLGELDKEIVKSYVELPIEKRQEIKGYLMSILNVAQKELSEPKINLYGKEK